MKRILLLIAPVILLVNICSAESLTREQALKLGSENGGVNNGKFWFEKGDASPPFSHACHIIISPRNTVLLDMNNEWAASCVDAPYDDGSETRLDIFTSSKGKGWVTAHCLKPEMESTRPKSPEDERSHAHRLLCSAAKFALQKGDLELLKILLDRGLKVNEALDFKSGDIMMHEAIICGDTKIAKFLLKSGARPDTRDRYGSRPIDMAIASKQDELCRLLAKPDSKEIQVEGTPSGLIEEVLPTRSATELFFVSWNDKDPSAAMIAQIRKTLPHVRPASKMETIGRRPLGAHSWYKDKETGKFGSLIQITLKKEKEYWSSSVRRTVGPAIAGGGTNCKIRKIHGYWYSYDKNSWCE